MSYRNVWLQFDRDTLQRRVDRLYGPQPPLSAWRLAVLLDSAGMSMHEYANRHAEPADSGEPI